LDVAAMNATQYATAAACGECVAVTGPNGKVTVRIVDKCPDCADKQLDLSQQAFAKIAAVSAGRVSVDWQVVPCDVTGPVAYFYKDGSSQYWTAIQVRNHRLPLAKLEVMRSGAYAEIARADYNYFVDDKGAGTGPVKVRVTAVDGQILEDTLPPVVASTLAQGASQFK
jgi:expansin (peptidoglycan-binding protein)